MSKMSNPLFRKTKDGGQMPEDGGRMSEAGGQMSEAGGQAAEDKGQRVAGAMAVGRLSDDEIDARRRCLDIMDKHFLSWVEFGLAVREFRDRKLYRITHATLEAFLKERYDIGRSTAYQYISGVEVLENVRNADMKFPLLPEKEALVRPLTKLDADDQPRGWQLAIHRAQDLGEETVMARHVIWAVRAMRGTTGGETLRQRVENVMGELPENFRDAFRTITESIYTAKRNRFEGVDRKKMLEMLDGLRRLIEG
jgi:hypothetical protein